MPFTITHAVLAPPLARLSGYLLPTAALAIGCMLPDLHRLFMTGQFPLAHQWQGIFQFNLWLGYAFCLVWYILLRPTVHDCFGVYHPLNLNSVAKSLQFLVGISCGLIVGNATHLIWDGLTHVDSRTFAFHDFLGQIITIGQQQYPLHRLLQVGTSILFLPVVLFMLWQYVKQHQRHVVPYRTRLYFVLSAAMIAVFSVWSAIDYATYFRQSEWQNHLYYVVGRCINELFQTAGLLTLGCCMLYQALKWVGFYQRQTWPEDH